MRTLPTYGMAGIGIVAAIGFIFALSFLASNSGTVSEQGQLKKGPSPSSQAPQDDNGGAASLFSKSNNPGASEENLSLSQQEATSTLRPALESIMVTDTNSQESRELVPNMQFESGRPVLIRAKFINGNDAPAENHTITLNIKKNEPAQMQDQAASFRGDIGARGSIELNLYWDPSLPGDYTLLIFSSTSSEAAAPESTIPLIVVTASGT